MASDVAQQPKILVRRFSHKYFEENPDDLASSLKAKETSDEQAERMEDNLANQWQDLFRPLANQGEGSIEDRYQIELERSSRELAKSWRLFQKHVCGSKDSKLDLAPPSFNDVFVAVDSATRKYKDKRENSKIGRVNAGFQRVCNSLYDHRAIFEWVPTNDKYVSLAAGSISAIVKAAVNHEEILESISDTLGDLSEDIGLWKRQLEVHKDNPHMKKIVAQLYTNIFQFFLDVMNGWMKIPSWRRALKSLDDSFLKKSIKTRREKLQALKDRLNSEGILELERAASNLPRSDDIKDIVKNELRAVMQEILEDQEKKQEIVFEHLERRLGQEAQTMLYANSQKSVVVPEDGSRPISREASPALLSRAPTPCAFQREAVKQDIQHLLPQGPNERWRKLLGSCNDVQLQDIALERIDRWMCSASSTSLWIRGEYGVPQPSRTSTTGAYVAVIANRLSVPALSHTCPSRKLLRRDVDNMGGALVELVTDLISQLIDVLPGEFSTSLDLSDARCRSLEPSLASFQGLLSLLKDLMSLGPEVFFCIINGLENISIPEIDAEIEDLLDTIRHFEKQSTRKETRTVKALFTTNGYCEPLTFLDADDVYLNSDMDEKGLVDRKF